MTKKKAIEVATKFVEYLKEVNPDYNFCDKEDIESIEYLIKIAK